MDNVEGIIDPPILYVVYLMYAILKTTCFDRSNKKQFEVKMKKTFIKVQVFHVPALPIKNINSGSLGFLCFLYIMSQKNEHCSSFKEQIMFGKVEYERISSFISNG